MANVLVERTYLEDIADAIRTKGNTQNTYTPPQMASAILNIQGGMDFSSPTKIDEVLVFPLSLIAATITYEKSLREDKTLTVVWGDKIWI